MNTPDKTDSTNIFECSPEAFNLTMAERDVTFLLRDCCTAVFCDKVIALQAVSEWM